MTVQLAKCLKINHFSHLHGSSQPPCKCHAKVYIFKSSVPQNEECFASKYLSENKFLAALILHESKDSGGSIILFLLTSY